LADEIAANGPLSFRRFMDVALYHPEHGYYRRPRDPFGIHGDFFTAEQLQPVFGILIAQLVRQLGESAIVELGAGRGEMSSAFAAFDYLPIDVGRGAWPASFHGLVFANEFFDALPVSVLRGHCERRVGYAEGRFHWVEVPLSGELIPFAVPHATVEVHLDAMQWLARIAHSLHRGHLLIVDYGFTDRERMHFPDGTLMSYRRHAASEDVLLDPGTRDITSHVPFTLLEDHAHSLGFETVWFEPMARTLLRAGEADRFASVLDGSAERTGQLKTLLYSMGESYRVLLLKKRADQ
jgi:SAM-dependent MidA family methyltransferase